MQIELDESEVATVLAALRNYQAQYFDDREPQSEAVKAVATANGAVHSLADTGINLLCNRLGAQSCNYDQPVSECQSCGQRWLESALLRVNDLNQRVDPGEPMPSGCCLLCGSLCQLCGDHVYG